MILLTRLNGPVFALNPDLVERADSTPDTVITLVDGTKYVVAESLPDFVALVRAYRASVVAEAQLMLRNPQRELPSGEQAPARPMPCDPTSRSAPTQDQGNVVVPLHRRER
ncbi:MAG: flagellar FlbD family protein [Micromonosporaceae bacterium]|nr:flagellar FlbD family protein [Micromonosporaceae bacterium]